MIEHLCPVAEWLFSTTTEIDLERGIVCKQAPSLGHIVRSKEFGIAHVHV